MKSFRMHEKKDFPLLGNCFTTREFENLRHKIQELRHITQTHTKTQIQCTHTIDIHMTHKFKLKHQTINNTYETSRLKLKLKFRPRLKELEKISNKLKQKNLQSSYKHTNLQNSNKNIQTYRPSNFQINSYKQKFKQIQTKKQLNKDSNRLKVQIQKQTQTNIDSYIFKQSHTQINKLNGRP